MVGIAGGRLAEERKNWRKDHPHVRAAYSTRGAQEPCCAVCRAALGLPFATARSPARADGKPRGVAPPSAPPRRGSSPSRQRTPTARPTSCCGNAPCLARWAQTGRAASSEFTLSFRTSTLPNRPSASLSRGFSTPTYAHRRADPPCALVSHGDRTHQPTRARAPRRSTRRGRSACRSSTRTRTGSRRSRSSRCSSGSRTCSTRPTTRTQPSASPSRCSSARRAAPPAAPERCAPRRARGTACAPLTGAASAPPRAAQGQSGALSADHPRSGEAARISAMRPAQR